MFVNSRSERDDGGSEAYKAKERISEFVVARSDAAEVLDPLEEVFDEVALAITRFAVASLLVAVGARRDAGLDAALQEPLAEGIAILTLVRHEHRGGDFLRHCFRVGDVRLIACTE